MVELADDLDRARIEAHLLERLPHRGGPQVGVGRVAPPPGKLDLAPVRAQVLGPARHHHHDVVAVRVDRRQHGRRPRAGALERRATRRRGGGQHLAHAFERRPPLRRIEIGPRRGIAAPGVGRPRDDLWCGSPQAVGLDGRRRHQLGQQVGHPRGLQVRHHPTGCLLAPLPLLPVGQQLGGIRRWTVHPRRIPTAAADLAARSSTRTVDQRRPDPASPRSRRGPVARRRPSDRSSTRAGACDRVRIGADLDGDSGTDRRLGDGGLIRPSREQHERDAIGQCGRGPCPPRRGPRPRRLPRRRRRSARSRRRGGASRPRGRADASADSIAAHAAGSSSNTVPSVATTRGREPGSTGGAPSSDRKATGRSACTRVGSSVSTIGSGSEGGNTSRCSPR